MNKRENRFVNIIVLETLHLSKEYCVSDTWEICKKM